MPDSPFIGAGYKLDSKPASVARTVNLMPVPLESGQERVGWVFRDVPGLVAINQIIPPVHTCTTGPDWEQVVKVDKRSVGMYYLKDRFVSPYLATGAAPGGIMSATDGETWTNTATFAGLSNSSHITSVAYGNNIFVAYGNVTNAIWYSSDGVTFLSTPIDNVQKLADAPAIWFGSGNFVLCGDNSTAKIWYGPAAVGMTVQTVPEDFACGVYSVSAGKHFAGCADTAHVYSSVDLVTWTLAGTAFVGGSTSIKKIAVNAAGVMVAIDGTAQRDHVAVSEDDGATWTASTGLPILAAFYVDLFYLASQDLWMLTDNNGFTYISNDSGATWTLQSASLNDFLGDNQNWWMAAHPDGFIYAAVPVTAAVSTVAALGTC